MSADKQVRRISVPNVHSLILATLTLLAAISESSATTWYADHTNGNDSKDGLSESNAWKTIAKVNTTSLNPGDTVLFRRGETWKEQLLVQSSGSGGNPIAFGAYGTGNRPIITGRDAIPGWTVSANWTNAGGNVWYLGGISIRPWRVWLNGTEYLRARIDQTYIESASRWWWDDPNDRMYVYATANPAAFYSEMETATRRFMSVRLHNVSHITLRDLDVRGGKFAVSINAYAANADHLTFEDCDIGRDSGQVGILALTWESYVSNYGIIRRCTIDSGMSLSYTNGNTYYSDGVGISGGSYWDIHDNVIADWYHNCIAIGTDDIARPSRYNKVHDNLLTAPNTAYCRGFSTAGPDGACQYNEIYRNVVRDTSVRNQIAGDHNLIYQNIIDGVRSSSMLVGWITGQGISIEELSVHNSHHNKIYNNVIANTDEQGIRVNDHGQGAAIAGHEIVNNIMINCGRNSVAFPDIALRVVTGVGGNIYRNNLIHNPGASNVVHYRDRAETVAAFNAENGTGGDDIGDSLQSDPGFVDLANHNFQLTSVSPCIDSGLDVGLSTDYSGTPVPQGAGADIGAFEYLTTDADEDGLPDDREAAHGLDTTIATGDDGPNGDPDGDGMNNFAEYVSDTDPTNGNSSLLITEIGPVETGVRMEWRGGVRAWQYLQRRQDLLSATGVWKAVFTNQPPTPLVTTYTDLSATNGAFFYRIKAQR